MCGDDDYFAPPAYKPAVALPRLQRELRALGLSERAGTFERQGLAWVQATAGDGVLNVALAKAPARTPQWQPRTLKDGAQLRDFIAAVKQQLARQDDRSE
jgi:hypothetical protein